ncbi:tetratricopeptide repeat protein [Halosquirtibacter laminarini]|uniref:Tetratricopeptide repeat protein n=1 Tax=Halosquirtibacter laminarini TaxID=3374600 RepID=A0AC61NGV1_9BACT|nr:tetratricopeptide repeat protein [Prolixibacteraceae bacterium]
MKSYLVLLTFFSFCFVMCKSEQAIVATQPINDTVDNIEMSNETSTETEVEDALKYAEGCVYKFDYKNAKDTLKSMYEAGKYNIKLLNRLESIYFVLGDFPKCIDLLDQVDSISPLKDQMIIHRGIVYRKMQKYEQANSDFSSVLQRDSMNVFLLEQIGDMTKARGLADFYNEYYRKAVEYGASPNVLDKYLKGLIKKNLKDSAMSVFYKYAPDNIKPYQRLRDTYGFLLYKSKRYSEAYIVYNALVEDKTQNSQAYYFAAMSLVSLNRKKEAIPFFEEYLTSVTELENYYPFYMLGCCYDEEGQLDKAMKMFDKALSLIYPKQEEVLRVYSKRGDLLAKKKNYKNAMEEYASIERFYPKEEMALFQIALLSQTKTKEYHKAAVYYQKVLQLIDPKEVEGDEVMYYIYNTSKSQSKKLKRYLNKDTFWEK